VTVLSEILERNCIAVVFEVDIVQKLFRRNCCRKQSDKTLFITDVNNINPDSFVMINYNNIMINFSLCHFILNERHSNVYI